MHIRCPHCRHPIEVVEDHLLAGVCCPSCGSQFNLIGGQETAEYRAGEVRTIGHFELIEQIGVGHFGSVWKARDTELDRIVAVKIPRKNQLNEAETDQFLREARAAAQLKHPNIVPVHEVGREGDTVYIVSDYVEGATLMEWLQAQQLGPREAAELCARIADALRDAHVAGVIHRDLKPGNIMMDLQGEPHIMDFGLAKRESGEITMTVEGHILGTPAYMPPEQARGEGHLADRRSDVYSVGVILYELLTGELPFRGETRMLIVQILRDEPARPRSLKSSIPRDLETICLKCLEKDPRRRYQTAADLAQDLRRYLAGEPILARPSTGWERAVKWAKRRPAVAALSAMVVLAVCTGTAGTTWQMLIARAAAQEARARAEAEKVAKLGALKAQEEEADARKQEEAAKKAAIEARDNEAQARKLAEEALVRAEGLRLSAEASAARHTDPALALLLATEAVQRVPHQLTFNVLYDALLDCREKRTLYCQSLVDFARYSADGRLILAGGGPQGNARTLDAATGKTIAIWRGYNTSIGAIDLSRDGRRAAATIKGYVNAHFRDGKQPERVVYTDRTTYIWDTVTGKDVVHLRRHDNRVVSVRFSPDGKKVLTASWDKTARLWDAESGKELLVLSGHECSLRTALFSPDGQRVLTLSSGQVESSGGFEEAKGPLVTDPGIIDREGALDHGASGSTSYSSFGEAIQARIFDAQTGKQLALLRKEPSAVWLKHAGHPTDAAFSPDGKRVVIAFAEGLAAVWDATKSGKELFVLEGQLGAVNWAAKSAKGVFALEGQLGAVNWAAFSPDGNRIVTDGDALTAHGRATLLWDAVTGKELLRLRGHESAITSVKFNRDGSHLLTSSNDSTARVWNALTGAEVAVFKGHIGGVYSADFSPDGKEVVTAGDATVRIWSVEPPAEACRVLGGHRGALNSLTFSPDGKRLLTAASDETPRLWDVARGKAVLLLGKDKLLGVVRSAHFSADGKRVVTASGNNRANGDPTNASAVRIWDADGGRELFALAEHKTGALAARLSPDGKRLVTVSDGQTASQGGGKGVTFSFSAGGTEGERIVRLWDATTGKLIATLPDKAEERSVPEFSPDGRLLLVTLAQKGSIGLFDAQTGKPAHVLQVLRPNDQGESLAAFSPDGLRVATAQPFGRVGLWDADTGQLLGQIEGPIYTRFIGFSPDSQRFVTLAHRTAKVWDARTRAALATLPVDEGLLLTAAFSPDGKRLLAGTDNGAAHLWDIASGKLLAFYRGHGSWVTHCAFSPDGTQVATGSADGTARIWPVDLMPTVMARQPRGLQVWERQRYGVPDPAAKKTAKAPPGSGN